MLFLVPKKITKAIYITTVPDGLLEVKTCFAQFVTFSSSVTGDIALRNLLPFACGSLSVLSSSLFCGFQNVHRMFSYQFKQMRTCLELLICGDGRAGVKLFVRKHEYHLEVLRSKTQAQNIGPTKASLPKGNGKKVMGLGNSSATCGGGRLWYMTFVWVWEADMVRVEEDSGQVHRTWEPPKILARVWPPSCFILIVFWLFIFCF